jgi:hypothetical protein
MGRVIDCSGDERYEERSKKRAEDFTRERKMTFKKLIWFMLRLVKASSQTALDRFFPEVKEARHMSQQAFSQARDKIKGSAFEELFEESVKGSYEEEIEGSHGLLPLAIDGSEVALPAGKELRAVYGTIEKTRRAGGMVSLLYDVENDIIVEGVLRPVWEEEREGAKMLIKSLKEKRVGLKGYDPVLLFDRGYPSKDFLGYLQEAGFHYVIRCPRSYNEEIDALEEGEEGWIRLKGGQRVRAYAFRLSSGEREVLLTDMKEGEAGQEELEELYWKRWSVETKYNLLKQKLQLENFSGRLPEHVEQDFYAMLTVANMLASLMREANRKEAAKRKVEGKKTQWVYKVNANHAIGVYKDTIIKVVAADDPLVRNALLEDMIREMRASLTPIRPNRTVLRLHKAESRKPHFHLNIKSNC